MMNDLLMNTKQELAVQDIEEMYTRTLTKNTKLVYIQTIKEFFGVNNLNDITKDMLTMVTPDIANQYARKLIEDGNKTSTANRKLSTMKNFYQFLCMRMVAICSYNPFDVKEGCLRFKNAARTYSNKRVLSEDEIKSMMDIAKNNDTITGLRDLITLHLLATTGMRREEICSIKLGNISESMGKNIIEITGKGDKQRIVVFSDYLMKLVKQYVAARNVSIDDKDEYLLVGHGNKNHGKQISVDTIYNMVKKYAQLVGINPKTVSPHCFRHTYATECFEMGMDIKDVQDLMGHSNSSTTQIYLHSYNVVKKNPANALADKYN